MDEEMKFKSAIYFNIKIHELTVFVTEGDGI